MAKTEKIVDDQTNKRIDYPYISALSLRVELSPTKFTWMGEGQVLSFENGKNLGEWAEKRLQEIIEDNTHPEVSY